MTEVERAGKDMELVRAARAGSALAFERLVEHYFGTVYAIAYARMKHCDTAEDLAQEVFLRAYLYLDSLSDPRRFSAWLCRITHNLAHDWCVRGQKASRLLPMVPLDDLHIDVSDSTAKGAREMMEAREQNDALREAIFRLPPDQREIVMLHFFEDLSMEQIAERFEVHPATISRHLKKALTSMKRSLKPILRDAAPMFRAPRRATVRTIAVIGAAWALSANTKTGIASAAGGKAWAASVSLGVKASTGATSSILGLLKTIPATLAAGGKIMGVGKAVGITLAAIAVAVGGTYVYQQATSAAKQENVSTAQKSLRRQESQRSIQSIKEKITVERSYHAGTQVTLLVAKDEAARLNFVENPAEVEEFIFYYDGERVDILYRCKDEEYYSTRMPFRPSGKLEDHRNLSTRNATAIMQCFSKWEPREGKAFVTFFATASEELKRKVAEEAKLAREHEEAIRQEARRVREWDFDQQIPPLKIIMDNPNDPNLVRLRTEYGLETLVSEAADEYEKLRLILKWTHDRFEHSGDNKPSKSDPLTILKEASEGKRFRCVEYAIIVAACVRSLGMPSRVLSLKRADVETAKSSAGHVVAEVWLKQFNKWVFVDGQWGAIPEKDGAPLNAVEFQDAIARNASGLTIRFSSETEEENYMRWIIPYLYYLDFNRDQRFFGENYEGRRYAPEYGKIMLVPKGTAQPKVFQQKTPIKNCTYISNPKAFYPVMDE